MATKMLRAKTRASLSRKRRPSAWAWVPRFRRPNKGSEKNWIRCKTIELPSPSVKARLIKEIAWNSGSGRN